MRSKALKKKSPEEIYSRQTALTDHSSTLQSDLCATLSDLMSISTISLACIGEPRTRKSSISHDL